MSRRSWKIEALETRDVPSTSTVVETKIDIIEETPTDEVVQTLGGETDGDVTTTSTEEETSPETVTPELPPVVFGEGNFDALGVGSKYVLVSGLKSGESYLYGFDANGQLVDTGKKYTPFDGDPRRLSPVRGAVGDVNGDGTADLAFVSGAGMTAVMRVIDGATGKDLISTRTVFGDRFLGGSNVILSDLDADGKDEIIVTPDAGGGPRVRIFSIVDGKLVTKADFFGIDDTNFRGGARTSAGDMNGDGVADLVVAVGVGGGPRVAVYDGSKLSTAGTPPRMISDFFALTDVENHRNGVSVSVGDLNHDGYADLVVGGGNGSAPQVFALDGKKVLTDSKAALEAPLMSFYAFDSRLRAGVRLAVKDVDGDGKADLVTGTGEAAVTRLKTFKANMTGDATETTSVDPFSYVKNAGRVASGVFLG